MRPWAPNAALLRGPMHTCTHTRDLFAQCMLLSVKGLLPPLVLLVWVLTTRGTLRGKQNSSKTDARWGPACHPLDDDDSCTMDLVSPPTPTKENLRSAIPPEHRCRLTKFLPAFEVGGRDAVCHGC